MPGSRWCAAVGLTVLLAAGAASPAPRAQSARPNILFILTDDLDAASMAYLPKIRALIGDRGVTFSNYFVNVSLCCPSRTTTLRGQYAHNTGILTNGGGNGGFETMFAHGIDESTVATWLLDGGYRTALYGKYLNGYPATAPARYVPPGWTDWASSIAGNAYSEYNYTLNENGRPVRYGSSAAAYGTDVYAGKADQFMRKAAAEHKPFFIYLAVYAPHAPATPAPRHANLFTDASAPRPASFNEADVSDKPAFIRDRPILAPRAVATIDDLYRRRLRSLQAVDDAVVKLVDTLTSTGQLNNTFIVFTSDNGFHMGQHRMASGKQTAYEEDTHVPLLVRGPGVPAARTVSEFAGNIDLAPTFADMGGVAVPPFVDGRSLLPLVGSAGSTGPWRQAYLIEHWTQTATAADAAREPLDADQIGVAPPRAAGRGRANQASAGARGIPEYRALRTPQYTYVEYVTGERELYDLAKDPLELNNLASKASAAVLQNLAAQLAKLRTCAGPTCR